MGRMTDGAGKAIVDVTRVLREARIQEHLLQIVTLAAQRIWSIDGKIRIRKEAIQQSPRDGCNTELVATLENVVKLRTVGAVGACPAEFTIVVAVVTIRAQDACTYSPRGICSIQIQHLGAQARLSQGTPSIMHDRMTGTGSPVKVGNQVQRIAVTDSPDGNIAVSRPICDLARTRTMTTQAVLILIDRGVEDRDAVGSADAHNTIL